jgi:hypothetical protein
MTSACENNSIDVINTTSNVSNIKNKIKNNNKKYCNLNVNELTYNDFDELNENPTYKRFDASQLKEFCRALSLKLSGTKPILIERLRAHFKENINSNKIIKIQRAYKRYLIKSYNYYHGPAIIKRDICVNGTDFLSMEELKDIPYSQFFSYKDKDNYIYGFDVISLFNLIAKTPPELKGSVLNPYNRNEIPIYVQDNLKKLISLSRLLKYKIDINIKKDENTMDMNQMIDARAIALFQKMDELGNYTDVEWFKSLSVRQLIQFQREILDIWAYRANLDFDTKYNICPDGDPFRNIQFYDYHFGRNIDINYIKRTTLIIIDRFINSGINKDSQYLGASFVLSALTLVNKNAADALPWLFQSVAHIS